jgi:hypothetical protein
MTIQYRRNDQSAGMIHSDLVMDLAVTMEEASGREA